MSQPENTSSKDKQGPVSKIVDPVFVCMCVAVALAIGSSLLLRIMSGGPSSIRASDSDSRGEVIFPAAPASTATSRPAASPASR